MVRKKICIITPDYISMNPRSVKEADALWQAGFDVRVVFAQGQLETIRYFDEILLKQKPWRYSAVGWSPFRKKERTLYWKSQFRYHLVRGLPFFLFRFDKLAEYGEHRVYKQLAQLAVSESADIYLGHYPTGLAVASYAASRHKALLGCDIEDLYIAEQPDTRVGRGVMKRVGLIESRYLPHCSHITAASQPMADVIAKQYNVARPLAIHNVYPWSERQKMDGQIKDRKGPAFSLYWFSQTIGLERGIQDAIRAAGLLKDKVQIHLRGVVSFEVKNELLNIAKKSGVEKDLYFHPPISLPELLSRSAEHDVGLALEPRENICCKSTVPNKFFFYMLAGLVIAATDTPGQKGIMSACPEVGFLYKPGDYQALAGCLQRFLVDHDWLHRCKQAALKAAQERWNWEKESEKLIASITRIL